MDPQDEWTPSERDARAHRALAGFRERRLARRGDDTYFGSPEAIAEEGALPADETGSRRVEVEGHALECGMSAELAGMLYDIALDEGLDPALAFEVVRGGMGVLPPREGLVNAPAQRETDKYAPEWVVSPPTPPDMLLRERTLRLSFRRLRGLLERHDGVEDALIAFAREPDVGPVGY